MEIRLATVTDTSSWLSMRQRLWPHCDAIAHRQEMELWLADVRCCCFLALDGDQALAFIEGRIRDVAEDCKTSPVGYVEGCYVEALHRRKGLGKALMRSLEDWFRQRGCVEMASDTELHNEASREAHLAWGFEESSRLIHFRMHIPPKER